MSCVTSSTISLCGNNEVNDDAFVDISQQQQLMDNCTCITFVHAYLTLWQLYMHNLWVVAVDVINTNVGLLLAIASKSGDNGYCSMVDLEKCLYHRKDSRLHTAGRETQK
jgi:hypothetical protein